MIKLTKVHRKGCWELTLNTQTYKVYITLLDITFEFLFHSLLKCSYIIVLAVTYENDSDIVIHWNVYYFLFQKLKGWNNLCALTTMVLNFRWENICWTFLWVVWEGDSSQIFLRDASIPEIRQPSPPSLHWAGCVNYTYYW